MKKFLYLLFVLLIFFSCSDDGNNEEQDYTSFVIYTYKPYKHYSCKAYCYNEEGQSKIYDIEVISRQPLIETSIDNSLDKMYITYRNELLNSYFKIDTIFHIQKGIKNTFSIEGNTKEIQIDNLP